MLRRLFWLFVAAIVIVVFALVAIGAGQDEDDEIPDPGKPPPGVALKVIIHWERGKAPSHPGGTTGSSASCTSGSGTTLCDAWLPVGTVNGTAVGWAGDSVPYTLYQATFPDSVRNVASSVFVDAFNTWTAVGAPSFSQTTSTATKGVAVKLDGVNRVFAKKLRAGALAVTYLWWYTSGPNAGHFAEFDQVYNSLYTWSYTPPEGDTSVDPSYDDPTNSGVAKTYDLRNIATHEAGHVGGLNDLYDDSTAMLTMYGYGAVAELKKDSLGKGDCLGMQEIYRKFSCP